MEGKSKTDILKMIDSLKVKANGCGNDLMVETSNILTEMVTSFVENVVMERVVEVLEKHQSADERLTNIVEKHSEYVGVLKDHVTSLIGITRKNIEFQNRMLTLIQKHDVIIKDLDDKNIVKDLEELIKNNDDELKKFK